MSTATTAMVVHRNVALVTEGAEIATVRIICMDCLSVSLPLFCHLLVGQICAFHHMSLYSQTSSFEDTPTYDFGEAPEAWSCSSTEALANLLQIHAHAQPSCTADLSQSHNSSSNQNELRAQSRSRLHLQAPFLCLCISCCE